MADPGNASILSVRDLSVRFSGHTAVDHISFDLHRGETLGIVGESGSGKTLTALSCMGLIPPHSGAQVHGEHWLQHAPNTRIPLHNLSQEEWRTYRGRHLAMVFQEPMTSLNPVFSCGDQVAEAFRLHHSGNIRSLVLQAFERVGLPRVEELYHAYPHQLSGGQKQRVMIAIALAGNPSVLIADEPTTALDVTVQQRILRLLKSLQQEFGMGIIFISHDLGVIAEIADRVAVMHRGKIVERGLVREVFHAPEHPYTRGLLACRPPVDHRVHRLPTVSDFLDATDAAVPVAKRITTAERQQQLERLYQSGQGPLLEVKALHTWFPGKKSWWGKVRAHIKAVNGVSFEVFRGETLGLVGESGCGKTTLSKTILQLLPAREGTITLDGQDLAALPAGKLRQYRKDFQIVFQDPYGSLNPRLMIGAAIKEPLDQFGIGGTRQERTERVVALLEMVGLSADHYSRYPHQFSGGERQRISIARALASEPKLLILDEPVSSLDVSIQAQVLNLLNELKEKQGLTYLFISHDLSVVRFMADRILVMQEGRIEESGDADALFRNPKSDYTRSLLKAIPKGPELEG